MPPEPHPRISEPMPAPVRHGLAYAARALFEIDESKLSAPRAALVTIARLAWLTVRGFFRERLQMRAAALAFSTVLAFVPAAALAFALADAVGATDALIDETVLPFLDRTLGEAPDSTETPHGVHALRATLDGLLDLVRSTRMTGLGVLGLIVVLLALRRVLRGVEEAFAHVFEHRGPPRPWWRRLRAYLVVAAIAPLGLAYAVTSAALTHESALARLMRVIPIGPLGEVLLFVAPPLVVLLVIYVVYVELPDADVQPRSALLGAGIAALAWYATQLAHVRFQVGLARWNAIYSGFGAFPVLVLEIQISWVIVLLGAQIVAAHQDTPSLRQLVRGTVRHHADRQGLALRAAIELSKRGVVPLRQLAGDLDVSLRPLRDVLQALVAHGLVTERVDRRDRHYSLAIEPSSLHASTVLEALERGAGMPDLPWGDGDERVHAMLSRRRAAASSADHTIEELARDVDETAPG